jgi:phospholipid/cholesterol/gamma-HCH transport system substrate-binding protein
MRRKETAIEVKVGALVLFALALFVAFIFVLGDFQFGKGFHVFVDLDNAGGLKPGADVRIAGIPAGSVERIEFRGGEFDEAVGRNVFVRVRLTIEPEMSDAIGEGAEMVITTLGVLGEPYVEIVNTTPPGPAVEAGAIFVGEAPVRMDQMLRSLYGGLQGLDALIATVDNFFQESDLGRLLTEAADLADNLDQLVVENRENIRGTIASVEQILEENQDRIPQILENVEGATGEFEELGQSLNRAVGDGSELRNTIRSLEAFLEPAATHAPETFADLQSLIDTLDSVVTEQEESLRAALGNLEVITDNFAEASVEANELIAYVNSGRGTVGALIRDDELYDDLRELIRELKRRPWRLIWKE